MTARIGSLAVPGRVTGWAKLPATWQLDGDQHAALARQQPGAVIAALKIYLGMCLYANFGPNERYEVSGCAQRSVSQLSHALKLSRPFVIKGLRLLRERRMVERLGGRPEIYRIARYDTARNWTRLPRQYLVGAGGPRRQIEKLAGFPSRGRTAANALRFYIYIASIRNRNTGAATVGYNRLMEILHLSRAEISDAISLLIEHQLITVRNNKMATVVDYLYQGNLPRDVYESTNSYFLRGVFGGRRAGRPVEDGMPVDDV
jgi:hypothetical protein